MNEIELKLKEYLSKHPGVIIKSLKDSLLYYEFIKINSVEIDGDYFSVKCQTIKGLSDNISPWFPIPIKFLRKIKLEIINKNI